MRMQVVVAVLALILAAVVVEALRRRRLSEGWALLWIAVAVTGVILGVARPLVDRLSASLGIVYGTSLVFALAIVFLVVVCINLSMQVSRLNRRVEILAEEVALANLEGVERGNPDHSATSRAAPPLTGGDAGDGGATA